MAETDPLPLWVQSVILFLTNFKAMVEAEINLLVYGLLLHGGVWR